MKKQIGKSCMAGLLAAIMVFASGCSGDSKSTSSGGNSLDADTKASATPYGKYSSLVTYTLGKNTASDSRMPSGDTFENNAYTRYIKEKLNIQNKDTFEANGGTAYDQKVSMAIASGTIPDVMIVDDVNTLKQLVDNDMVEDLTNVYKNCTSDKIKDIYKSYGGSSCFTEATFDGKLMALPSTNISSGPNFLWLRKDWMDKLGLSAPKSIDDVENIIQQFTKKDPGGNGAGKTVGLTATSDVAGKYGTEHTLDSLFSLYGAYPKQWMKNSSGEVYYGSVAPEMKTALTKISDMYKKGEIDKQFAVRTADDTNGLLINGTSGSFYGPWWAAKSPLMNCYKLNKKANWQPYVAPLDTNGKLKVYTQNPANQYVVVRKGYAHPEIVMKINSLIFDYSRYTDKNPAEIDAYTKKGVSSCTMPMNINIDYNEGVEISYEHINAVLKGTAKEDSLLSTEKSNYTQCAKYLKDPASAAADTWATYTSRIIASKACKDPAIQEVKPVFFGKTDSMKLKWAGLDKLEKESLLKIITGEQSVSSFDQFVSTWNQTGGSDITKEVKQKISKQK